MPGERKRNDDHIKVVVRSRPLNSAERAAKTPSLVTVDTERSKVHVAVNHGSKRGKKDYHFDMAFSQYTTQEEIYNNAISPIVEEVLQGFNCTVFAYGQTGTGKTYTMEGDITSEEKRGIIPRAVDTIFTRLQGREDSEFSVKVSFLEIYNESLRDLLSVTDDQKLRILEDKSKINKGVCCHNLEEVAVKQTADLMDIMGKAMAKRRTAATKLNEHSSRSHCIFTLTLHSKETTPEGEDLLKVGKLNLVDLAGSECVGRSGAKDARAKEAGNINQSLLTLGRVITALVERSPHVPYRDSKLTRLLQESLGGRAKTCIIATVAPSIQCLDETLSTLDYAQRAKRIKNKPVVNQRMTKRVLIREYNDEIERLKSELACARTKDGVFLPEEKYSEMMANLSSQTTQLEELETTLEQRMKELTELKEIFEKTTTELEETKVDLKDTKKVLGETKEVLQVTEENLKEEKVKVEETNVLLDAHVVTEKKLTEHASDLHNLLDATISDVKGLHGKIGRKVVVETHNLTAGEKYHVETKASISNLKSDAATFAAGQIDGFKSIALRITDAAGVNDTFASSIKDDLAKLQAQAESGLRAAKEGVFKMSAEQCGSLEEMESFWSKHGDEFRDIAATATRGIQQTIAAITKTVESHQNQMKTMSAAMLNDAKAATESLSAFVKLHRSALEKMDTDVSTAATAYKNQMVDASHNIRALVDEENKRAEAKVQSLATMFADAMKAANKERLDRIEALYNAADQQQAALGSAFQSATKSTHDSISNLQSNANTFFDDAANAWSGIQKTHASHVDKLSVTALEIHSGATALEKDVAARIGDIEGRHAGYLSSYVAAAKTANKNLSDGKSAFEETCSSAIETSADMNAKIVASVDEHGKEIQSWSNGTNSKIAAQQASVDAFATAQKSAAESMVAACDTFFTQTLSVDVPTGMTPAKREYPHKHFGSSPGCPATSPHDIILQRYRKRVPNVEAVEESVEVISDGAEQDPQKDCENVGKENPAYGEHNEFSAMLSGPISASTSPPAAPSSDTILGESTKGNVQAPRSLSGLKRTNSIGSTTSTNSALTDATDESLGDENTASVLPSKLSRELLKKMKVNTLRAELGKRGLSKMGRKDALINRLLANGVN